jgi:nucleotide-binding universal stress UspA family protein
MKILLPVDGSKASLAGVRFAIRMARAGLGVRVLLVNVQEPPNLYELVVAHDPQVLNAISAEAGAHLLAAAQELLHHAHLPCQSEVVTGDPAQCVIDLAEQHHCDMIVLTVSGMPSLPAALLGSVSREVLHAASVPVVVVKADAQQMTA